MTGFSRFLVFMLIAAPLAYIGASYYNGQDGIQNIKNLLGIGEQREAAVEQPASENRDAVPVNQSPKTTAGENQSQEDKLDSLNRKVEELSSENEALKRKLENLEKTVEELKNQGKSSSK